jgi:hypothetical protein
VNHPELMMSAHQAGREAGHKGRRVYPVRGQGDEMKTRKQALEDEFDDLEEEFFVCGNRDERCRCARRMQTILAELTVP